MTDNTPVPWTANGFSLHTKAWSVKSFGGRRFFGPAKRGDDFLLPFRRGRLRVPKVRDQQVFDLAMWVIPVTAAGTPSPTLTREQQAHKNWRDIVAAVDVEGAFPLVKRWYDGATIMTATGVAEYFDGTGPDADDGTGFSCALHLLMSDPYFYAAVASQSVGAVTILGEVPTDHVVFTLSGGTNQRITLPDGNWMQFNGSTSTPVVLDWHAVTAIQGGVYVNGLITRNPLFMTWPMLTPGSGTISLTGGGTATFTYDAAYR